MIDNGLTYKTLGLFIYYLCIILRLLPFVSQRSRNGAKGTHKSTSSQYNRRIITFYNLHIAGTHEYFTNYSSDYWTLTTVSIHLSHLSPTY